MVALQEKEVQENEEFRGPQALLRVLNANLFGKLVFLKNKTLNIQQWPCLKRSLSRTPCDSLSSPRWGRMERKEPHFPPLIQNTVLSSTQLSPPSSPLQSPLLPSSTRDWDGQIHQKLVLFFHVFEKVSVLLLRPLKLNQAHSDYIDNLKSIDYRLQSHL